MSWLPDASSASLRSLLIDTVQQGSTVITDGWQPYRPATADLYNHERLVSPGVKASDLMPGVHRIASLAQRWLLGTHQGAVDESHLTSYLDEFVFRFNRRAHAAPSWSSTASSSSPPRTTPSATAT